MLVGETSVTTKGQVTIPVEVRKRLGLKARDRVVFELDGDVATIRRAPSRVLQAYGAFGPISTADILNSREDFERAVAEEVMSEA
jgi:AbrB family looped-hinge helix DNA binding protein